MKFTQRKKTRVSWKTKVRSAGSSLWKRVRRIPSPVRVAMMYLLAVMIMTSIFLWRVARYYPEAPLNNEAPPENIQDTIKGEHEGDAELPANDPDLIPVDTPERDETVDDEDTVPLPGQAVWPVSERTILTGFNEFISYQTRSGYIYLRHLGIDIAAPEGTPVVALWDGKILEVKERDNFYGRSITVEHGGNLTTFYGNLSEVNVMPGDRVEQGQMIGRVGNTAVIDNGSNEPYLHLWVRHGEEYRDPLGYLP